MTRQEDTRYAFVVGKIRALETKLLDKGRWDRLIAAGDINELYRLLAESEYGELLAHLGGTADYERLLEEERKRVVGLIKQLSYHTVLNYCLFLPYDIHNLKVLLKEKQYARAEAVPLVAGGIFPKDAWKEMVAEDNYSLLPEGLQQAVKTAIREFERTGSPEELDVALDRDLFTYIYKSAQKSGITFLQELIRIIIDLKNIELFLRSRRIGKDKVFLEKVLLHPGRLEESVFITHYGEPDESLAAALAYSPYAWVVKEGMRGWKERGSLAALEQAAYKYLLDFLIQSRDAVFGLEPLVNYWFRKGGEIDSLRVLFVAKEYKLDIETVGERLRVPFS